MSIGEGCRQPQEHQPSPLMVMPGADQRRSGGPAWWCRFLIGLPAVTALLLIGGRILPDVLPPNSTTATHMEIAAPSAAITLSETRGAVGRPITVSGTGFASGEYVDVRWKSAAARPLDSVRAGSTGSFSTRMSIPDAPTGQYAIIVTGRTATKQASATYTVTPSLSRVPAEGAPWTPITITARGFGANEDVKLTWLSETGSVLGTIRTNGAGSGSVTIRMPNGKPGWNDYTGYGLTSRARSWGALRILSSVTLSSSSAAPGATVDVVARGFQPGQSAAVTWNTTASSRGTILCADRIAANGTLVCRFSVPRTGAGAYPVTVTAGGISVSATLAVAGPPAVRIEPAKGAIGTDMTLTAGGFTPNEAVAISWDRGATWRTVRASSQGAISIGATVPKLSAGQHALTARGTSSGKTATTPFTVASTPVAGSSSRIGEGVYSVYATREGLVGGTTSSGHRIVENDYFVSLPGCTPTNCPGGPYWGNMTNCGSKCYVKVINPRTNACRVEPILDTGPWFRVDDWWNTTSQRYLNNLASNPNTLTQGYTGADAARNGLDVGYGVGPNGIGMDDTGTSPGRVPREVGNRSAIDIADGTWYDLGIRSDGTGGTVTVHMLWQTGADPAAQARACGHPLNERPVNEVTNPPGTANPSFTGVQLSPTYSSGSSNGSGSGYVRDGRWSTAWYADGNPSSGQFIIDYGRVRQLSGVRWGFNVTGYADQFTVQTSVDRVSWSTVGTYGNAPINRWYGAALNRQGRYLRVTFANPNADIKIGYMAEIQLWGSTAQIANPSGTANPSFTGEQLTPASSSGSSNGSGSGYVRDGRWSTAWYAEGTPSSGHFIIDYGQVRQLTGVRWGFNVTGYADQFIVDTSVDRQTWSRVGTYGNAPRYSWYGAGLNRQGRYLRVTFMNPNVDVKIGYMAEIQLWGSTAEITNPPGTANPTFSGAQLPPYGSSGSSNGSGSRYVHDNIWSSSWYTVSSPASGHFIIDYGQVHQLTGVRWGFNRDGYADQFTVQTSIDRATWTTVGTFGNAPRYTWYGRALNRQGRYVRVIFANPNGDDKVGHMADIQLWGTSAEPAAMNGSNPQFSGAPIPIVASNSSTGATAPNRAHDQSPRSSWETLQASPPSQAILTLDLGRSQPLTGIRWMYRVSGGADRMRLQISADGSTWTQLVTTSNRAPLTWEGWRTSANARYVRLVFDNPNGDPALGYVAEVEIWGPTTSFSAARAMPAPERANADIAATPASEMPAATPLPNQDPATPLAGDSRDQAAATPMPDQAPAENGATGDRSIATPGAVIDPSPPARPVDGPTGAATSEPVSEEERISSPVPPRSAGGEDENSDPETTPNGDADADEVTPTAPPVTEPPATETPPEEPVPVVTGEGYIAFTGGDGANCRTTPDQDGNIISLLTEGAVVDTIGEPVEGWQPVICDGRNGYVFAEFVSRTPPVEATEPVAPPETSEAESDLDLMAPEGQTDQIETPDEGDDMPTPTGSSLEDTPTAVPVPEPTAVPTEVPTPEPELVRREVVILAAADTSVTRADPSVPQSPDAVFSLPAGGEDGALAVLTFPIEGVGAGTVVDAQLLLTGAGDAGGSGGQLRVVEGVWFDESSATWNDVADAGGWNALWIDRIEPGEQTVLDLTGIVTGDAIVSLVIEGVPDQQVAIASTESGTAAYLVITIEELVTPDPE